MVGCCLNSFSSEAVEEAADEELEVELFKKSLLLVYVFPDGCF